MTTAVMSECGCEFTNHVLSAHAAGGCKGEDVICGECGGEFTLYHDRPSTHRCPRKSGRRK